MELEAHRSLLWIAREALKEDLPPHWSLCQTPAKDPFYFNFATAESSWEHPCDGRFKQLFAHEKLKLQERRGGGGRTPRCDAIDALAGIEVLEGCLRRAIQLDLCVISQHAGSLSLCLALALALSVFWHKKSKLTLSVCAVLVLVIAG
eukprot:COSAG03_NODE_2530_length_2668_cov_70.023745_3_plen_148_part_00